MANAAYDFAKGRFFILSISADGPCRIEGHKTYATREQADAAALQYLRQGFRKCEVIVCQVEDLFGLEVSSKLVSKSGG